MMADNYQLKPVMEKILSKFPEVSFAAGMGEFQKLGF
jgi:hypothetical protein